MPTKFALAITATGEPPTATRAQIALAATQGITPVLDLTTTLALRVQVANT